MQETRALSPVWEDSHTPWINETHAPQLLSLCPRVREPQLLKPLCHNSWSSHTIELVVSIKESHRNEKPAHGKKEEPPLPQAEKKTSPQWRSNPNNKKINKMVKKKQTKERTWELSKQRECLWTRGWPSEEELPQAKHLLIRQNEFQIPAAGGESTQGLYGNDWAVSCRTRESGAQRSLLRKWEGSGGIWASSSNPDSLRPLIIVLILQVFLPFCLILLTSPFLPLALFLCNEHSLF